MEAPENQLPESGVQFMNSIELLQKVRYLNTVKQKNEAAISPEDLRGKYRTSYEKLCAELSQMKKEYRASCTRNIRLLNEWLTMIADLDESDEAYQSRYDEAVKAHKESGNDPMLARMMGELMELFK